MAVEQEATMIESQRGSPDGTPGRTGSAPVDGSVYALLLRQAARFADHDLFVLPEAVRGLWDFDRKAWSYADTLAHVDALANAYREAGYGVGHRVALLLENRPTHFFHWLALNAIGASVVPVNPDYTHDELVYLLKHSETVLLVCLRSRLDQARPAAEEVGVAIVDVAFDTPPRCPVPALAGDVGEDSECALVYTSGTTGKPKGCLLSNGYFLGWSEWYTAQGGLISLRDGEERLMTPLPTFHVNAMGNSFMGMLGSGGAQVIVDRFHPRTWWEMAIETRATCFHYLGVMPAILLAVPPSDLDRSHGFRFGMGGGVHPDHHGAFEARFGVPLLEGWAMTETGAAGILCAMEEPRHVGERCLGRAERAGPPTEMRIVDDAGDDVPDGMPGELVLRARGEYPRRRFFSGYLKNEAATAEVWSGGWLHTGDIMRRGDDGCLYFVDRKKNIIRRSGENIAAIEVEAAIVSHPSVAQVAVVAVSDPLRDEEVLAAIVLAKGADKSETTARSVFDHCGAQLAYYKLPGYVAFVDRLPTTSTQKIRKSDLGALAVSPLEQPDCHDLREAKQQMRARR